jgi:ABC-type nickel/cobalt efflux system permease component RcnA
MLALGLLFMIVAAAVTAGAIYDGGEDAEFEVFGQTIGTTVSGVFVAGIATMLLFFLGVYLLMKSLARSRRKRHERKETKTRQRESVSKIEEERAQLRAENEALQEKLARDRRPDPATTTGETATASDETMVDKRHVDTEHTDHQHTDLTAHDTPASSTSGRHRDEV